jgi:hypothetical protein
MAILLVQSDIKIVNTVNNTTLAFPSNVTAGNLICVCQAHFTSPGRTITTPVDTLTHTYVPMTAEQTVTGEEKLRSYYVENCSGGANTVTFDIELATTGDITVVIAEFSGIVTTGALDKTQVDTGVTTTDATSEFTASLAQADELLWGAVMHSGADTTIAEQGGASLLEENEGGSSNMPLAVSYQIVSAIDTYAATWTFGAARSYAAHIATFKAAAAAGGIAIPIIGRQFRERRS